MSKTQLPRAARRRLGSLAATGALALAALVLVPAAPAAAATVTVDLYTATGLATMPGGQSLSVWGYRESPGSVTAPGGPVITVDEGDTVNVTLHNDLAVTSSLLFQGQSMAPDLVGTPGGTTKTYTFTADHAGTYLYEAGLVPGTQYQVPMGLYGALVVRPATAGQAYAGADTAFDDQAVLVLGEIDPALNNAANKAGFDLRKFNPKYTLINGKAHPDTDPIDTLGGHTVLLRYVNAGLQYHSMGVMGASQTMIALDGSPLSDARHYTAETIGPGQTADALVAAPGEETDPQRITVYDASLTLHNSNLGGAGGMLTTVDVAGSGVPGPDATGPVASDAAYDGTTLTVSLDDTAVGGGTVTEGEFYVDDVTGTPTALTGTFGTTQVAASAPYAVGSGQHVVYVRGRDDTGNWGAFSSVLVSGSDTGGPTTLAPSLTPALTNHANTGGVAVSATADDSGSGNSSIAAAEYFIDAEPTPPTTDGTGEPMVVNTEAPVASVDATIPAGVVNALPEGPHVIYIHAQDAQGNWGGAISLSLDVDTTGPGTSGLVVSPTPNNGTIGVNSGTPAVRVVATTLSDPVSSNLNSSIAKAELFIDTVGTNGSGIPLIASDGFFNDTSEGGYADIPLSTVRAMTNGTHTVYVHAKDAAGNWGSTDSATLLVDKVVPTLTGLSVTPAGSTALRQFAVSGAANDGQVAVTGAEWFTGTDPGVGKGKPLTVSGSGPFALGGTIDGSTLAPGTVVVKVRVRDAAGNWSKTSSASVSIVDTVWFSTVANTNPTGVGGTADDADIYRWSGSAFSRALDATAALGLPATANVDAYTRVDATHFYLSFATDTAVPTLGTVADEDVVFYDNGSWTKWYDGSTNGVTDDLDAVSVVGGTLYFSTRGNVNPPGLSGGDNADVYRWDGGSAYTRVWGAVNQGLPGATNVDGLVWIDDTHLFVSFDPATTQVPGIGQQQDEDVVKWADGQWSVYFDGTAHGLGASANLDLDAFDVP